jgi:thiamine transport system substrate-binding protein
LAQFEKEAGVKLRISKAGDAGEMLNKLILTRKAPVADVVFGIDNALAAKALAADVLDTYTGPAASRDSLAALPAPLVPVDFGYVTINYDKAWFAKRKLAVPTTLEELAQPANARLLVVQNPATSSTGYGFLLATIGALGEEKAFDWWARMRQGGMKVAKGWTEAYYTDFSRAEGGTRPLVVSYATSPPAEVLFADPPRTDAPTASIEATCFRQVEFAGVLRGTDHSDEARQLVDFLAGATFQAEVPLNLFVYPARTDVPLPEAFTTYGSRATDPFTVAPADIAANQQAWIDEWTAIVLR